VARPRKTDGDAATQRLRQQKRESYERHREERKAGMRRWYRDNQSSVRAQQSRYKEEAAAWKYQPRQSRFEDEITPDEGWKKFARSTRWHGTLGGVADRLSIINEFELRFPTYKLIRPNGRIEKEHEYMDTKEAEMHDRHRRERNKLHTKHDEERTDQIARHIKERRALDTAHEHEHKGGHRRSDDAILADT